jgi:hypothetical protein
MPLDRTPIRESGSSDLNRVRPAGDFDGTSRRQAMKDLLAKHDTSEAERRVADALEQNPAHAFWTKRLRQVLGFAFAFLALSNSAGAQIRSSAPRLTPQEAADVLRRLDTPANITLHPPCSDCDGPKVFVLASTPGAASWLTFPPESPRRRLDGTLLSDPPTVYGFNPFFVPVLTAPHEHSRRK